VLVNELSAFYTAFLRGEEDPLLPLPIQYADYAVWQREWIEGEVLQQQAAYWKTALADVPTLLELPADHPRPVQTDYAGAFAPLMLDEQLTAGLRDLSRRHGATLYMTLLAGWAVLLARLSGQQDLVVGTPTANRGRAEIESLIGFFVNMLPMRIDLSGSPTVSDLLAQVKAQSIAAQHHQDIPFEQVVEILQPVRSLSHSPLFQVMFAWQNNEPGTLELPGLELQPLRSSPHRIAKFDMALSLGEIGQKITGGLEYATSLFERETIERYLGYFRKLLEAMVADEAQQIDRLPVLPESERRQVLYEWNDTKTEYPSNRCVHELFEAQVGRTPAAVAVVFEYEELSYGELNARANQLAHHLRELGVKPDDRVAICVERGFEMIIGLLGVLKAGGAYVPLDPAYPVERLRFMLEDSGPVALLTQAALQNLFEDLQLPMVELDDENAAWRNQPDSNPDPHSIGLNSSHLAYIIYTSGSTGTPKGVMVEHASLVNFLYSIERTVGVEPIDSLLAVTTFSFDIAALEFYLPLIVGARVVMARQHNSSDPAGLIRYLQRGITVLQATPATWRMLFEAGWQNTIEVKALCGGEALSQSLSESLFTHSSSAWNLYGPTETTVWSLVKRLSDSRGPIPIGRPIGNTQVYILDAHGEPVPV
ncbi:AMP-binding protein, partial [Granulicella sp. L60]|uniref:non-ribosomal peptide synthetase n=1 Tax=Granulicella sp. L60 TaxID=1641866 RepID=UPI001C20BF02